MEVVMVIIVGAVGWYLFTMLVSAGTRTVGAAAKAAVGKGSFSDNMEVAFQGMGQLEARFQDARFGENEDGPAFKAIEVKGLFPVAKNRNAGFITSVFDSTGEEWAPVLSTIELFQEPDSIVYQHTSEVGNVGPDQGFIRWARVGAVVPELLQPPFSGQRDFIVVLRLVDLDNLPSIELGRNDENDPGILWTSTLGFQYSVTDKGYQEVAEHRDKARALSVQIGMAVAMADGSLDDSEGLVLKEWIIKMISAFSGEKHAHLKKLYNNAMTHAYDLASEGDLTLSVLTEQLNEIADRSSRYETIELCFDVMAADGVADTEELNVIRTVAEALELDFDEIEKLRDQKIVGLDTNISNQASIEDLLGLKDDWDSGRINKHLLAEFQKWNNRLTTLEEGQERDNAQRMLDLIAEARKKHA
jgi:tellurite resistance protein